MSRLWRLAAIACALALALSGCGSAPSEHETPAPSTAASTAAAEAPVLDPAVEKRLLTHAAQRLADAADRLNPHDGYPRSTSPDGSWQLGDADNWTSGFFAGSLWLMDEQTGDPVWRTRAERWTAGLELQKTRTDTHDLGFVIFDSFGWQYQLTNDPHARDVAVQAARSLATRFNPAVGAIKSWDVDPNDPETPGWRFPVIIDNLMNLQLLSWAAGQPGGDPAFAQLATRHALTSARVHLRPDGSTAHVALFDPVTGAFQRQETWQGQSATSTWSRGQAWAIHGFTDAYRESMRPELLDAAQVPIRGTLGGIEQLRTSPARRATPRPRPSRPPGSSSWGGSPPKNAAQDIAAPRRTSSPRSRRVTSPWAHPIKPYSRTRSAPSRKTARSTSDLSTPTTTSSRPSADYTGSSDQSLENAAAGARCREARSANDSVATRVRRGSV